MDIKKKIEADEANIANIRRLAMLKGLQCDELRILNTLAGKLMDKSRAGTLMYFILDDLTMPIDIEHLRNLSAFAHTYIHPQK